MLVVLVAYLGIAWTTVMLGDLPAIAVQQQAAKKEQTFQTLLDAKKALEVYALMRAHYPLAIAAGNSPLPPRLLMFPCPDNLGSDDSGDKNLDGAQDPTCAAQISGNDHVNNILYSGSRFGRLPWQSRQIRRNPNGIEASIDDGINRDMRDSYGNRFWYAVTRNMATHRGNSNSQPLLNFHSLSAKADGWLSVANQHGMTLNNKVVAVVLAPNEVSGGVRISEDALPDMTLSHTLEVQSTVGRLYPPNFFQSYVVSVAASVSVVMSNADKDGTFVFDINAPRGDDQLAYVDFDSLHSRRGYFFRAYQKLIGVNEIHNQPFLHSRLSQTYETIQAYYDFWGFFPTPMAANYYKKDSQGDYQNDIRQHPCAHFSADGFSYTAALAATVSVHPVRDITVYAATTVSITTALLTATLNSTAAVLLHHPVTVEAFDNTLSIYITLTLAPYARITITSPTDIMLPIATATLAPAQSYVLPAGSTIQVLSQPNTAIPEHALIQPPTKHLFGWLAEGSTVSITTIADNSKLSLFADTTSGFLTPAELTMANTTTITLTPKDRWILPRGESFKLLQAKDSNNPISISTNYKKLNNESGIIYYHPHRLLTSIVTTSASVTLIHNIMLPRHIITTTLAPLSITLSIAIPPPPIVTITAMTISTTPPLASVSITITPLPLTATATISLLASTITTTIASPPHAHTITVATPATLTLIITTSLFSTTVSIAEPLSITTTVTPLSLTTTTTLTISSPPPPTTTLSLPSVTTTITTTVLPPPVTSTTTLSVFIATLTAVTQPTITTLAITLASFTVTTQIISMTTVTDALPTTASFFKRQRIIWAHTDIMPTANAATRIINAPAVIYPWRAGDSPAKRENIRAYPACLTARNFYNERVQQFLEEQPFAFAVSQNCHYGGERCAQADNGFTLRIAPDATIALPEAVSITNSFTLTAVTREWTYEPTLTAKVYKHTTIIIPITDGTLAFNAGAAALVTLKPQDKFTLALGATITAAFRVQQYLTLTAGEPFIIPATTHLIGVHNTQLTNIRALAMYSPKPLLRVACGQNRRLSPRNLQPAYANEEVYNGITITVFYHLQTDSDRERADNILQDWCYWFDLEENVDGDGLFYLPNGAHPRQSNDYYTWHEHFDDENITSTTTHPALRNYLQSNDYLMLFGGQLTTH